MENYSDDQPSLASIQKLSASSPQASLVQPAPQPTTRPQRTWYAVLALYFIAPFIAEMLTGSTPPLHWNNIGGVMLTLGLYGSGAILTRELVRRRGLGWGNLALLGAAYGVLEEGMAFQSWFNPTWTPPPDHLRFFDVNWTFALAFTTIHMVLSISSSIILAEAIFPKLADRAWLGRKGFIGFTLWLVLIVSLLFFSFGFRIYYGKGYDHPPVSYLIAPLLFVLFLVLGMRRYHSKASEEDMRPVPGLWTLRLLAFVATVVFIVNLHILRTFYPIAAIPFIIIALIDLIGILLVRRWARRRCWGMAHRLALITGVMSFFIIFSPFLELVDHMTGIILVNLLALCGLIWLALRTASLRSTESTTG